MSSPNTLQQKNPEDHVQLNLHEALTLYRTIPTFNDPKIEAFWKNWGKRRKCWSPAFSPFPTVFSSLTKTNSNFSAKFNLLSANAFNLDQSKKKSGLVELKLQLTHLRGPPQSICRWRLQCSSDADLCLWYGTKASWEKKKNVGYHYFLLFPQCF